MPEGINPNIDNIDFILNSNETPEHTTLQANFINYYTLNASLSGNIGSTDDPNCSLNITPSAIPGLGYSEDTPITLEVDCSSDADHWHFDQWDLINDELLDDGDLNSATITFPIENNITIINIRF